MDARAKTVLVVPRQWAAPSDLRGTKTLVIASGRRVVPRATAVRVREEVVKEAGEAGSSVGPDRCDANRRHST